MPATGVDRFTGRPVTGFAGAVQRADRLWSTRIGAYPMLRAYGSITAELLGRRVTPSLIGVYRYGLWLAVDTWEPCLQIAQVLFENQQIEDVRLGQLIFDVGLYYLPNGHLGDFTVEGGLRRLSVGGALDGVRSRIIGDDE